MLGTTQDFCDETLGICRALSIFCVIPFTKTLDNLKVISPFPPLTSIVHSINCIYYLEVKWGGIRKILQRERVDGLFYFEGLLYFYSQTLLNCLNIYTFLKIFFLSIGQLTLMTNGHRFVTSEAAVITGDSGQCIAAAWVVLSHSI